MVDQATTVLVGMKAIRSFLGRSEATVLKLKTEYPDMPICKVEGVWESDTESLTIWRQETFFRGRHRKPKKKS